MVYNPYLEAWRNDGLDAARDLAISMGENVVIPSFDDSGRYLGKIVANPQTQVASIYDEYLKLTGQLSPNAGGQPPATTSTTPSSSASIGIILALVAGSALLFFKK